MATQTKSKNGRKNGNNATTPDLLGTIGKRGPGRPKKVVPTRTAAEIADSLEAQAKKLQSVADGLRGKV